LSAEYYAPDLCPQKQKKEIVVDTDRVTQYTVTSNYIVVDGFSWGILARVGMFFFSIFDGLESWDMGGGRGGIVVWVEGSTCI